MSLPVDKLRLLQTKDAITARLLTALAADPSYPQPTGAWAPSAQGGLEMSIVEMAAGALAAIVAPKLQQLALARFLDLAAGDFLTYLAEKFYKMERRQGAFAIQNVQLVSTVGAPACDFAPGELWVAADGGNRYVNLDQATVASGATVMVRFIAEFLGSAYNDAPGTIKHMVTAPAGVSCSNVSPGPFLPTTLLGTSTGRINDPTLAPSLGVVSERGGWLDATRELTTLVKPSFGSIRIRITATGVAGVAGFEYSTNGGSSWSPGSYVGSVYQHPGTFAAYIPTIAPEAFIDFISRDATWIFNAGDVFTIVVGDNRLQAGADPESDVALRSRCRDRWSTLSPIPTEALVRLWCFEASPEIARVRVDADPLTPGATRVVIASATGQASPAAQLAVEDYIAPRLCGYKGVPKPGSGIGGSPEETIRCITATPLPITAGGLVLTPKASLAAVKAAASRLWSAYLGGVDIGGTVYLAELIQAVMDAGALDFTSATLNGSAANVKLIDLQVAGETQSLAAILAWKPV